MEGHGKDHLISRLLPDEQPEVVRSCLAAILNSSDDAIVGKDFNGVITSWNKAAERILGYTAEEAIGHPVSFLMPPDAHPGFKEILQTIHSGHSIDHLQTVRVRKD